MTDTTLDGIAALPAAPVEAERSTMTGRIILRKAIYWLVVFLCIIYISRAEKGGCLTPAQISRHTPPNVGSEVTASWYGREHHNKLTASGQRFNMSNNTLAHRTLPLGTKVRLVNLDNGKSAEGIVNDRGPYIKGRDVDVSYAMAKQLGFVKTGVMKLYLETIL
jgi:rare lipoprotein A